MKAKDFSLRIEPELLLKLHYIATYNDRSVNRDLIRLIRNYVSSFEEKHGTIPLPNKDNDE